jgi:poly(hydroxyalkanoate) depolymerase family esterase
MSSDFTLAMRQAAQFTRAYRLSDATRTIQNALRGRSLFRARDESTAEALSTEKRLLTQPVDLDSEFVALSPEFSDVPITPFDPRLADHALGQGRRDALGTPEAATFVQRSFTCAAGSRDYKLYVPSSVKDRPRGLVVMLHGCTQNPDDFATGTNMNVLGEAYGLLVAYPRQPRSANMSSCWNWFDPKDQVRDSGEPAVIAGITRELMAEFGLHRDQVFVAGLSAGGAMAAVMGETYPDIYSAVGIHSGLAYRAAKDVMSAFSAMRGNAGSGREDQDRAERGELGVRTIVFQGKADHTVDPSNAARIVAAVSPRSRSGTRQEHGATAAGRRFTRTIISDGGGTPVVEYWLVDDAGHAWSGGCSGGSYTDPQGPDASAEMVRFFLATTPAHS